MVKTPKGWKHYSTYKSSKNAEKGINKLRKKTRSGMNFFGYGSYARFMRKGRRIYIKDGWN